ncbi:hypothetical protein HYU45_02725 [Candidatus Daviesbacteria bacterium]|nr:hypothetical protein [Candidatus Daviesbacteria bacterium]
MAADFHLAEKSVQLTNLFPWVWRETGVADGLGEYYPLSLWAQPLHTFFGLLALGTIPFEIQAKIFGLVILILGFWGIWRLLDKFDLDNAAKSVGSIFFLLNSFFLLLFDGGQLSLALAYGILPTVILYFLKITETDLWRDKFKLAFWTLILSIADIRIIYLSLLIVFIFIAFRILTGLKSPLIFFRRLLLGFSITSIVLIGFHMYWLLPTLISKQIQLPQTYERTSQVTFLSFSSLSHSLLLQQPHWPQNVFGRLASPRPEFVFIPLLAFSVLILAKRNTTVAFWLLISIISIFLSKGSNEPFGQMYSFLFTYVPGFSLFRDPSKFYFLTSLSYSILLAFLVQALSKVKFLPVLFILYFIFLARPVFLGQMSGLFSFPLFQKEFDSLAEKIKNDVNFSRVFWIPATAPMGYTSTSHPTAPANRLSQKRPFAVGTKGTYETFNFLREAPYMGQIFDVAGIDYIVYPYLDPRRDNMHKDNIRYFYTFLDQLSNRPWLSKIENSPIPLLKTKQHQEKFFITPDVWWVIGSDSIYNEATKSAQLKLSKNALIFAEEKAGLGRRIDEIPEAKIILNNKTGLDLTASFIDSTHLVFPAKSLGFGPDQSGWWKRETADLVWWRSFLQEKYGIDNQDFDLGGGWAIGEGNLKFALPMAVSFETIRNLKLEKNKVLLARVMESSRSGSLKFYQDNQLVGELLTKIDGETNVRWFEVGELSSDKELEIISEGDINVVNVLAVLDKDKWITYQTRAGQLKGRIVNFDEKNALRDTSPEVTYKKINPTKYKVKIEGLTAPSLLIFSQNYDQLWKMNNQTPLPVYSLLNGFRVEKDGEYIVEFKPQKYVYPGLVISGITVTVLLVLLIRLPPFNKLRVN